jgi:hypothetical protein
MKGVGKETLQPFIYTVVYKNMDKMSPQNVYISSLCNWKGPSRV